MGATNAAYAITGRNDARRAADTPYLKRCLRHPYDAKQLPPATDKTSLEKIRDGMDFGPMPSPFKSRGPSKRALANTRKLPPFLIRVF